LTESTITSTSNNVGITTGLLITTGVSLFQPINIMSFTKNRQYMYTFFNKEKDTFITVYFVFDKNDMFNKNFLISVNKLNVNEFFIYYVYSIYDDNVDIIQYKLQELGLTNLIPSIQQQIRSIFGNKETGYIFFTPFLSINTGSSFINHYIDIPVNVTINYIRTVLGEILTDDYTLFYTYSNRNKNIYTRSNLKKILDNLNMCGEYIPMDIIKSVELIFKGKVV
jgi:hypothetical protein